MGDLGRICSRLEKSIRSMCRKSYYIHAGKKDHIHETEDGEAEHDLYTFSNVEALRKTLASVQEEEDKGKYRLVYQFLLQKTVERQVEARLTAEGLREGDSGLQWEGQTLTLHQAKACLWTETDREKRRQLSRQIAAAEALLQSQHKQRWQLLQELARESGYENYNALYEDQSGIRLEELAEKMRTFLQQSDAWYKKALFSLLTRNGMETLPETWEDWLPLLSGSEFDDYFREIELLPTLEDTLYGLGINILQQSNLVLDAEKRPHKAVCRCAPTVVPKEVYLFVFPRGGWRQYQKLLHEAGRAEYYAHIREDLPWMYKLLGDPALPSAYAQLLENLLSNSRWLEHHLEMPGMVREEFRHFYLFCKLFQMRKWAGKFLYEWELYAAEDLGSMAGRFRDIFAAVVGCSCPLESYLSVVQHPYSTVPPLLAGMFAVQLRALLEEKYGGHWFQRTAAGQDLKQMWALGGTFTLAEWCHRLHISLDYTPFIQEIKI